MPIMSLLVFTLLFACGSVLCMIPYRYRLHNQTSRDNQITKLLGAGMIAFGMAARWLLVLSLIAMAALAMTFIYQQYYMYWKEVLFCFLMLIALFKTLGWAGTRLSVVWWRVRRVVRDWTDVQHAGYFDFNTESTTATVGALIWLAVLMSIGYAAYCIWGD